MTGEHPDPPRQLWLLPRASPESRTRTADVAVRARTFRLLQFGVPPDLEGALAAGVLVRVPVGRHGRLVEGWCVRVSPEPWTHTLPPIAELRRDEPSMPASLVALGLWVGEYYGCPPGRALAAVAPPSVLPRSGSSTAAEDAGSNAAPSADEPPRCREDDFTLSAGQAAALEAVRSAAGDARFSVLLLFGAPGSGKTEVYVRAIRDVVAGGRQAILLVPEIALATQIVDRLARRFARVAVLHSRLPIARRRRAYADVAAGRVDVVIGTRTAVYAPCPRLGLIVVDEEQESSFKSLSAPYYHARDVAIKRAQLEGIAVVLGSATPALETWHNASALDHYRLVRLPDRVAGATQPRVSLISTAPGQRRADEGLLSQELLARLRTTLEAGRQALLLHNRRGYAVGLRCTRCGLTPRCMRCGVALVFHRADEALRCHRCGARQSAPRKCPDDTCAGRMAALGFAIQKLEEELRRAVPQARLLRLDRDTTRRHSELSPALERFEAGGADVLLGTQMAAKGLDFPRVGLVGVIDADAALALPDFRASERVFQLLVQVVGRAGRSAAASEAVIQCRRPDHPVLQAALRLDYEGFARTELALRRETGNPPFARLLRLVLADDRPGRAGAEADRLARALRTTASRVSASLEVGEAQPCVVRRERDRVRWQVLVRGPRDDSVQRLLAEAADRGLLHARTQRLVVDVDPMDML